MTYLFNAEQISPTKDSFTAPSLPQLYTYSIKVPPTALPPGEFSAQVCQNPELVWLHNKGGIIGFDPLLEIHSSGADRFKNQAQAFSALKSSANIIDSAKLRGSGLLAFASFSYSAQSPRPSKLIIPAEVLAKQGSSWFYTFTGTNQLSPDGVLAKLQKRLAKLSPSYPPKDFSYTISPAHSPLAYRDLVSRAINEIHAGGAQKIVLSERFTVDIEHEETQALLPSLLQSLTAKYEQAWTFKVADILGASPEMLIQTTKNQAFSRVLAGSRPVADGAGLSEMEREAFKSDLKEIAEHEFAVNSVLDPLKKFSHHIEASNEPFVLKLPGLEHLASDIKAELKPEADIFTLLEALHPSAAVSGTPKKAADEIIAKLEVADRAGYAAPVGWVNSVGDGEFAIALRMAHLKRDSLIVHAGGGLVKDSDPIKEHAEVLAKTRPLIRALEEIRTKE